MKRQLIHHTHINTKPSDKIDVCVGTDFTKTNCFLERVCRDGLTLSCDADTLQKIMPNKACTAPRSPIILTTSFTVTNNIEAKSRIIFARRLSKNRFIIELKFIEISEVAMQNLDNYIEANLIAGRENKYNEQNQTINKPAIKNSSVHQINKEFKLAYSKVA